MPSRSSNPIEQCEVVAADLTTRNQRDDDGRSNFFTYCKWSRYLNGFYRDGNDLSRLRVRDFVLQPTP